MGPQKIKDLGSDVGWILLAGHKEIIVWRMRWLWYLFFMLADE
jgi:hypothetical protein